MLFSSTTFLFAFLPIVLITYYIVPRITRNLVLFIFSLVFYAWGEPVYIVLMIASTIVAYITGLLADKQRKNAKKYTPLIAMIGAVVWNIGLLLFFKYTDFFIGAANSIFGTQIKTLGLALPIGISFYSFQTLSYVIDVYKGEVRSQKNFLDLATYVALFPQLIAGPIVRYIDVAEQLKKRNESIEHFAQGVWRFSIGLGKKVILANTIGELFDTISNSAQSELSVAASWLGIIAYADLFRLLRLQRHGHRPRPDVRLPLPRKLQLPLHLHLYHRFLETLAYVTFKLVQRLCLYPTWR